MVSSTPRPHFTPGKYPVPILQEAGRAPGSVWTGGKSLPYRDSIPDRPARSIYNIYIYIINVVLDCKITYILSVHCSVIYILSVHCSVIYILSVHCSVIYILSVHSSVIYILSIHSSVIYILSVHSSVIPLSTEAYKCCFARGFARSALSLFLQ